MKEHERIDVESGSAVVARSYWDPVRQHDETARLFRERSQTVTLVIPTLNEERGLQELIQHCKPFGDEICIVDGRSQDRTQEIAAGMGVRVLEDSGHGKGAAIRKAIDSIDADILVFIDADFSHNPADIPRLVVPILCGEYDHVMGSRTRGGSDELHGDFNKFMRMIGSDIITLGINYRYGVRLTDSQNGFRAIKTEVGRALKLKENITTIEQEMTMKTLKLGYRLLEVPTHEYSRRYGESRILLSRVAFRYVYSWLRGLI